MLKVKLRNIVIIALLITILAAVFVSDRLDRGQGFHYSNKVAVLEYHHIAPQASDYTLTPNAFEQHLKILKANHYQVISMQQFIGFLNGENSVPPDAVVITFDDGYESFYQYAYPLLLKYGMTATNFVIVNYIGTNPGISFLTWDEIITMKKEGFSFYSHTFNSHDFVTGRDGKLVDPLTNPIYLSSLNRMETEAEYEQRVTVDLAEADRVLQDRIGTQDRLLCVPHGRYNSTLLRLSSKENISYIFTGQDGMNTTGANLIYRINVGSSTPLKLIQKLNDEMTLLGNIKIVLKNFIQSRRMSE